MCKESQAGAGGTPSILHELEGGDCGEEDDDETEVATEEPLVTAEEMVEVMGLQQVRQ